LERRSGSSLIVATTSAGCSEYVSGFRSGFESGVQGSGVSTAESSTASAAGSARIPDRASAAGEDPRSVRVQSGTSAARTGLDNRSTLAGRPVEPHAAGIRAESKPLQRLSAVGIGLEQHHQVTEGESLQSIAQQYYGSTRYAPALWEANRAIASSPHGLTPGVDLLIPAVGELDPTMLEAIEASSPNRLASQAPAGRGESSPGSGPGQRRPGPAARATNSGESGRGGRTAASDPARQAPFIATQENSRFDAASAGLTDTLESQPDSRLSDVIEPSSPHSIVDSPVSFGTTSDPMVTRAEFEARGLAAERSRFGDDLAFPRREAASDRPVRSANPGASKGVYSTGMGSPQVSPADSRANAQALRGRITLPDFEPIPSPVPVQSGPAGSPRQTPGSSREMLVGSTSSPPAGTRRLSDNARDPSETGGSGVPDEGGSAVHIMKANESWASIARDRLGDPRRADELFKMNREFYGEGFRPRPGMRLVLPPRARGGQVPTDSRDRH